MLTQDEANYLIQLPKKLTSTTLTFPAPNTARVLDVSSLDGRNRFIIDINRKGTAKPNKCSYQNRYRKDIILIRLDIDGPDHQNPDGEELPCPHVHIYREGYDDKWAYPLPCDVFTNPNDLIITLIDFLRYCNVTNYNQLFIQGGLLC